METKISVQLYTFRRYLKTPDQIRETLSRIKDMEISHIEAARIKFTREEAAVFQDTCKRLGMTIGSTQIKYTKIMGDFDEITEIHRLWGCSLIAVSPTAPSSRIQGSPLPRSRKASEQ